MINVADCVTIAVLVHAESIDSDPVLQDNDEPMS